ncbi:MAG TPA: PspC domain-containing protein [Galbitalea sp.]|jgi:phage shock protein PspC (stress-responsive transcriptional regulator)|nr:PspC domain-containing protein [Galbitalea sp.]
MAEFRRPTNGKVIGGVCAAIADRFGIGRNTVRLIAVVSCLLPGPQFVLYLILWIAIPAEQSTPEPTSVPAG